MAWRTARRRERKLWTTFAALLIALPAGAQEPASDVVLPPEPAAPPAEVQPAAPLFEVGGRVEARADAADDSGWERGYQVRAILGADFRPTSWLRGQVELGVSQFPELRDAWLRADLPGRLEVQVGRFRSPFGRFEQTSRWDLPLVRRGALSEQSRDNLGYGGRRNGIELATRGRKRFPLRLKVTAGVFQGDTLPGGAGAEDAVLRAEIEPLEGLSIGAGGYVRGVLEEGASERWLAGLDAAWQHGSWHVIGEAQAGPQLVGGAALVAYRWTLGDVDPWWLEPAFMAELVQVLDEAPAPLFTSVVGVGRGPFRARAALELGTGRQQSGSSRWAAVQMLVGAEF